MKKKIAVLSLFFLLTACDKDDPITPEPNVGPSGPRVGSTFTFDRYEVDSTTGARIESTKKTSTYTVTSTTAAFLDKSAVSLFVSNDGGDTMRFCYLSSGDVLHDDAYDCMQGGVRFGAGDRIWDTVPTGSARTATTRLDTTYVEFGKSVHLVHYSTYSRGQTETVSVGASTLNSFQLIHDWHSEVSLDGVTVCSETPLVETINWVPSIGFFARMRRSNRDQIMTSYTLK
jgi:hypothetical protein